MIACGKCVLFGRGCPKNIGPYNWLTVGVVSPCASYSGPCPLPRVGSKDWGWSDKAQHTMKANGDRYAVTEYSWGVDVECNADYLAENMADVDLAKRICELHARREWMRKNRGRKDGGK